MMRSYAGTRVKAQCMANLDAVPSPANTFLTVPIERGNAGLRPMDTSAALITPETSASAVREFVHRPWANPYA